ncbi:MAG: Inner rane component of cytoplasmic domain [Thermoplasmata archaeon]|nr:Inner rane component of cytoplasmic domain [Thermoplasmata archaeon]
MGPEPQDDEALAATLSALASKPRLALLRELRVPRTVSEIEIQGARRGSDHVVARQTVRVHLDRLEEAGLVLAQESSRGGTPIKEYLLNHPMLFALSEELRELARRRGMAEPHAGTMEVSGAAPAAAEGPRLVIIKGADEGRVFRLDRTRAQSWTLGRSREAGVALDYDPFVSARNSLVRATASGFTLEDLPTSRNGTSLDLRQLGAGERGVLRHGSIVGVGRSALVFWE